MDSRIPTTRLPPPPPVGASPLTRVVVLSLEFGLVLSEALLLPLSVGGFVSPVGSFYGGGLVGDNGSIQKLIAALPLLLGAVPL